MSSSILRSIETLASETDAWLVDIWGVMHNGVEPFAGAVEACRKFRNLGGTVLLLSNAPRPADAVAAQLERIGVSDEAWDSILSSGDASRMLIAAHKDKKLFHLGPERDLPLYDGLDAKLSDADEADVIVCSGLFDDTGETPDDYSQLLSGFAARGLPMICANPDIKVERGDRIIYCAGAIAAAYAQLGGSVTYAGKPYLPIYELAFGRINKLRGQVVDQTRLLAIGDGIKTDIKGAMDAGVRAVYVASGVHLAAGVELNAAAIDELFPDPAERPFAAMTRLTW